MKIKTVCRIDVEGFFIGQDRAFESPLEPGVFLIPAGCVDAGVPEQMPGFRPKFDHQAMKWQQVESVVAEPVASDTSRQLSGADAVQFLLDSKARQSGYESILAAISYADEESVPAFAQEGRKFRAWRSKVWEWFYSDQALATKTAPELAELIPAVGG